MIVFYSFIVMICRWVGLIGHFRPKKLITSLKAEVLGGDELELPAFKDVAKHFLNKSLYSAGLCSQFSLSPTSSLYFSTEGHGEKEGRRTKAMLFHKASSLSVSLKDWFDVYFFMIPSFS